MKSTVWELIIIEIQLKIIIVEICTRCEHNNLFGFEVPYYDCNAFVQNMVIISPSLANMSVNLNIYTAPIGSGT